MIDRDMKYMLEKIKHVQQVVYVCAYVYEYIYIVSTCSCGCVQKCIICTHMYGDGGQTLTQNVLFYHFSSFFFYTETLTWNSSIQQDLLYCLVSKFQGWPRFLMLPYSAFSWVLEIQTQVFMTLKHVFYQLRNLPRYCHYCF